MRLDMAGTPPKIKNKFHIFRKFSCLRSGSLVLAALRHLAQSGLIESGLG